MNASVFLVHESLTVSVRMAALVLVVNIAFTSS